MKPLSFAVRSALMLYTLPFLLGGILLAVVPYSWLYDSLTGNWRLLLLPSLMILVLSCIFLGGLVAYGFLIVTLLWVAPNSPLLVKAEEENPSWSLRLAGPAFARMRAMAGLFAPRQK